ncbi:MAG: hypothetical protein MZW92_39895 [Comamonadaceae bacterium]|nr:hypothetical protein [Comamonadaceae bacterium]
MLIDVARAGRVRRRPRCRRAQHPARPSSSERAAKLPRTRTLPVIAGVRHRQHAPAAPRRSCARPGYDEGLRAGRRHWRPGARPACRWKAPEPVAGSTRQARQPHRRCTMTMTPCVMYTHRASARTAMRAKALLQGSAASTQIEEIRVDLDPARRDADDRDAPAAAPCRRSSSATRTSAAATT